MTVSPLGSQLERLALHQTKLSSKRLLLKMGDTFYSCLSSDDGCITAFVTVQVNYGGLLLQALLEHWPRPYVDEESEMESQMVGC